MHDYFAAEESSGYLWGGVGLAALGGGAVLLTRDSELARGMSYPILAVGLIQTVVGGVLLIRTDAKIEDNDRKLAQNERVFRDDELARIKRVNSTFLVLEIAEAAIIAGGATLAIASKNERWKGVGLGLAIQGVAMLTLDGVASARAHRYQEALEHVTVSVSPGMLTIAGSF